MSNDLVKRLRDGCSCDIDSSPCMAEEECRDAYAAADRIEELEAELHLMKTSGVVEVAVRNPSVMEYMQHWESRAERAEAKLAKAVKLIELAIELGRWELNLSFRDELITFTTELTSSEAATKEGGKDG